MHKLTESILDKFSMDYLRNQVLKNAYGNDDTVIAGLDPRVLLVWYLFFGLVPWFLNDLVILLGLFIFVALTTRRQRSPPWFCSCSVWAYFPRPATCSLRRCFLAGTPVQWRPSL